MGTVFKRTATKPLPVGAELFSRKGERLARWRRARCGRRQSLFLRMGSSPGRNASLSRRRLSTPTTATGTDIFGALPRAAGMNRRRGRVLAGLEKRAEKVRSGIITTAENAMANHQHTALTDHLAEFVATMQAAGRSEIHVSGTERLIQRVIGELNLRRLSDIQPEAVERWLAQQAKVQPDKAAMGARTRNSYLIALRSFCNWCVERDRLPFNPLAKLDRADERSDRRRQRRALTEAELSCLLIVARLRPLAEYGRETMTPGVKRRSGTRQTQTWSVLNV